MEWISFAVAMAAGLVLLFAGRRFLWLVAGLAAFLFGYALIDNWLGGGWASLIVAVVLGLIFAWLAMHFVKLVAYLVGALAGAAGLPILLGLLGITWPWWAMALLGAALGILLIALAFEWGLIIVTAWAGSNTVVQQVDQRWGLESTTALIIAAILLLIGLVVQGSQLRRR